jgi:hypothetical protein
MNTADNRMRLIKFNASDIVVPLARLEKVFGSPLAPMMDSRRCLGNSVAAVGRIFSPIKKKRDLR